MLQLEITTSPLGWDDEKQEFVDPKTVTIQLEHSLVSISKWESKWCKPFWSKTEMTTEETIDYVRCMTVTRNVSEEVYKYLTNQNIEQIREYIAAPMTATWFSEDKNKGRSSEQVTSELIYYWMIALGIPSEYEKWHLNRLLTLIRVCNVKNAPPKKMSKRDIMSRNAALNAARRNSLNTKG